MHSSKQLVVVLLATVAAVGILSGTATANVLLTGNYSQDFNSMGAPTNGTAVNLPSNWFVGAADTVGNGAISGTQAQTYDGNIAAGSGSIGNYNFGNTGQAGRSLGSMATTSKGHRAMEVRVDNLMGSAIGSFELLYDGKQWRVENGAGNQKLTVLFSMDGNTFTPLPTSYEFNSIQDGDTQGSGGINGDSVRLNGIGGVYTPAVPIPANATFYLRWFDFNDGGVPDHGLAIDNVKIQNMVLVPEPATMALLVLGAGLVLRRPRH